MDSSISHKNLLKFSRPAAKSEMLLASPSVDKWAVKQCEIEMAKLFSHVCKAHLAAVGHNAQSEKCKVA